MEEILDMDTVRQYNQYMGVETCHPLVTVMDGSRMDRPIPHCRKRFGLYVVFIKDLQCVESLSYGRRAYDYQANTLVFVAPGQVLGNPRDGSFYRAHGWVLAFSPELLRGTRLGSHMKDYTFFSYAVSEALHISAGEREILTGCLRRIDEEARGGGDAHSTTIIASTIELLLDYCDRFYDRQFRMRHPVNRDLLSRFEQFVEDYLHSDAPRRTGTPTVAYFADRMHLSPNYFGDLIKKETGQSASEYIQRKMMDVAKDLLALTGDSVADISDRLGYQYPNYFSRAFKRVTGFSPGEYRKSHLTGGARE